MEHLPQIGRTFSHFWLYALKQKEDQKCKIFLSGPTAMTKIQKTGQHSQMDGRAGVQREKILHLIIFWSSPNENIWNQTELRNWRVRKVWRRVLSNFISIKDRLISDVIFVLCHIFRLSYNSAPKNDQTANNFYLKWYLAKWGYRC